MTMKRFELMGENMPSFKQNLARFELAREIEGAQAGMVLSWERWC